MQPGNAGLTPTPATCTSRRFVYSRLGLSQSLAHSDDPRQSAGGKTGKESTSFLKKRSKKLLNPGPSLSGWGEPRLVEVFWFFFSKKNGFLPSPDCPV
jgi:hypothetical protein